MKFLQYAYIWNVTNYPYNTSTTDHERVSAMHMLLIRSEIDGDDNISKSNKEEYSRSKK